MLILLILPSDPLLILNKEGTIIPLSKYSTGALVPTR
jgi:hypothetical protein